MKLATAVDFGERIIMLTLSAAVLVRFAPAAQAHLQIGLLVLAELFEASMVIARPIGRPIATRPYPIALGIYGAMFPMFVTPEGYQAEFATMSGVVMAIGLCFTVAGKVALNRRFGAIPANRGVQVRGPYRLVRHPIYLGYLFTHVGFLLTNPTRWNFGIYTIAFSLQILRIFEEEKFLSQDAKYRDYKQAVRYRLLPGLF